MIQDAAHPVTNSSDILNNLNLYMIPQHAEAQITLPENPEERLLFSLLIHKARHIDDLTREANLAANEVAAALTMMELKGLAKHVGGMQYTRADTVSKRDFSFPESKLDFPQGSELD